jgi:hypothetical protein
MDEDRPFNVPRDAIATGLLMLGVLLLVVGMQGAESTAKIRSGDVAVGTYVVDGEPRCSLVCRSSDGTFTSDDGKVTRSDVSLGQRQPLGLKKGDRIRAVDIGDEHEVHPPEVMNNRSFFTPSVFGGMGLAGIVAGLVMLWRNRNRTQSL